MPLKQIIRKTRRTAAEAERDERICLQAQQDFPPTGQTPADRRFIARAMAMHRDIDRLRRALRENSVDEPLASAIVTLYRACNGPTHGKFDTDSLISNAECRALLELVSNVDHPAVRVLMNFEPEKVKL